MAREKFILDLERAADNVADIHLHEFAVLLRRAALLLRNVDRPQIELDHEYQALINDMDGDYPGAA